MHVQKTVTVETPDFSAEAEAVFDFRFEYDELSEVELVSLHLGYSTQDKYGAVEIFGKDEIARIEGEVLFEDVEHIVAEAA